MLTFRDFDNSDQDYATVIRMFEAVWPDRNIDPEEYRRDNENRPAHRYFHRLIGEIEGVAVGYGIFMEAWWNENPGEYEIVWNTHPDYCKRGIASAYYDYALGRMAADGKTVQALATSTREDRPEAVAYLTKRGFVQENRYPRSELKLDEFDESKLADYLDRPAKHGLVIKPLSEIIPNDPDYKTKLWELEWIFEQDEPTPDPPVKVPFDEYCKDVFESLSFAPEAWMIALDGERFAGMSTLWIDRQKPHLLHTGWTGVDRPYRKKGLAMAMKLHAIAYAKAREGVTTIETDNHETNWMYQINVRLGFEPIPAFLSYRKKFVSAEAAETAESTD